MRAGSSQPIRAAGVLIVFTPTFLYSDGGVPYYPHTGYDILDERGGHVRRVENHRGLNDETPESIRLAPGRYVVRPFGQTVEVAVTIEAGLPIVIDWSRVEKARREVTRGSGGAG
jgi:hypothetical protein